MTSETAVEAMAVGFARGLRNALRAERPDLAWEVSVGPVDRAKLARLEAGGDEQSVDKASSSAERDES